MKLINREIDALISKLEEERSLAYKKEEEDFKTNPKVVKLATKLIQEYNKFSKEMKHIHTHPFGINVGVYWTNQAICFLKLTPKTPRWLDKNTRRDIILASADSKTIEEVLTKLKLKK